MCKSIYIRSRRACDKFASTDVFLAIWRREGGTRYSMLEINILPSVKTIYVNLGPIIESKASINGNYCILKMIFLEQLQLNYNNDF